MTNVFLGSFVLFFFYVELTHGLFSFNQTWQPIDHLLKTNIVRERRWLTCKTGHTADETAMWVVLWKTFVVSFLLMRTSDELYLCSWGFQLFNQLFDSPDYITFVWGANIYQIYFHFFFFCRFLCICQLTWNLVHYFHVTYFVGHTQSWGASHKELLTPCYTGAKPNGDYGPVYPASESTYTFMKTLFKEIASVFPDKYIHAGGDEVSMGCWYVISFFFIYIYCSSYFRKLLLNMGITACCYWLKF